MHTRTPVPTVSAARTHTRHPRLRGGRTHRAGPPSSTNVFSATSAAFTTASVSSVAIAHSNRTTGPLPVPRAHKSGRPSSLRNAPSRGRPQKPECVTTQRRTKHKAGHRQAELASRTAQHTTPAEAAPRARRAARRRARPQARPPPPHPAACGRKVCDVTRDREARACRHSQCRRKPVPRINALQAVHQHPRLPRRYQLIVRGRVDSGHIVVEYNGRSAHSWRRRRNNSVGLSCRRCGTHFLEDERLRSVRVESHSRNTIQQHHRTSLPAVQHSAPRTWINRAHSTVFTPEEFKPRAFTAATSSLYAMLPTVSMSIVPTPARS